MSPKDSSASLVSTRWAASAVPGRIAGSTTSRTTSKVAAAFTPGDMSRQISFGNLSYKRSNISKTSLDGADADRPNGSGERSLTAEVSVDQLAGFA